ncbi:MAG: hypothetical protein JNN01_02395 [Opitutaceae bacterium]|nr:hypothetical protein [Opitutaceae bacterium]
MSTKQKTTVAAVPAEAGAREQPKTNPEIDAKIDAFIKEKPQFWQYLESTPKERLQRMLVLKELQTIERQQRVREGTVRAISTNPDVKQAYDTLLKDVPEDQRQAVMMRLVGQVRQASSRGQRQGGISP